MDKKIQLEVVNIIDSEVEVPAFALLLQEIHGARQLSVIIGAVEAQAISFQLNNIRPPRPLTHDLFAATLNLFEVNVMEIVIYKAVDGVFFSRIYYQKEEEIRHIDSRTSDAIALAVRMDAPIYINNSVLEQEGIPMGDTPEKEEANADKDDLSYKDIPTLRKELAKAVKHENYELASVLRDEIARRQ